MKKPNISENIIRRISKLEAETKNLKEEIREVKKEQESLKKAQETVIIDDLSSKKPGLNSYSYTYNEVAERQGVSVYEVQKIANKNGLRRKFKIS